MVLAKCILVIMATFIFFGCDSIPVREDLKVREDRDRVLEAAHEKFSLCLNSKMISSIKFKFRLYRTGEVIFNRPISKAYDIRTGEDQIQTLSDTPPLSGQVKDCLKSVLKGLEFYSVYPSVEFMETHEYEMFFNGLDEK